MPSNPWPAARVRPLELDALPPFPAVARKLLSLICEDKSSLAELAKVLQTDAAFSAEVMRLANSALLGQRNPVTSVHHAVSMLGIDRLRSMVLTVGLRDFLRSARRDELLRRCWRHNLTSALVAESLAEYCHMDKADCYTAGLLHDVGRLALIALYPAKYLEALHLQQRTREDLLACEKEVLGIDHIEAGIRVSVHWKLPASVRQIDCHARAWEGEQGTFQLTDLVGLSCQASKALGFSMLGEVVNWSPELFEPRLPPEAWDRAALGLEHLRDDVLARLNVFECQFLRW